MKHGHNFVPLKQAVHSFEAESEKELSLAVGDYVVVRKVVYFILKMHSLTTYSWIRMDNVFILSILRLTPLS